MHEFLATSNPFISRLLCTACRMFGFLGFFFKLLKKFKGKSLSKPDVFLIQEKLILNSKETKKYQTGFDIVKKSRTQSRFTLCKKRNRLQDNISCSCFSYFALKWRCLALRIDFFPPPQKWLHNAPRIDSALLSELAVPYSQNWLFAGL